MASLCFNSVFCPILVTMNAYAYQEGHFVRSGLIIWNVIVASLLGGLAGHELSIDLRDPPAPPLVGALSGLFAAILIASFAITIHMLRDRLSKPQM